MCTCVSTEPRKYGKYCNDFTKTDLYELTCGSMQCNAYSTDEEQWFGFVAGLCCPVSTTIFGTLFILANLLESSCFATHWCCYTMFNTKTHVEIEIEIVETQPQTQTQQVVVVLYMND